jgi:hypothetical protein
LLDPLLNGENNTENYAEESITDATGVYLYNFKIEIIKRI